MRKITIVIVCIMLITTFTYIFPIKISVAQDEYKLTVSVDPVAGGSVGAVPSPPYHNGTVVTLTASVNPGYVFDQWSGDASGTNPVTTVTMDGNRSVTAHFTQNVYTLTINVDPVAGGSVGAVPSPPYYYGDVVTLTASVNPGYVFDQWSGDASGTNPVTTVTMDENRSVDAQFSLEDGFTLTLTTSGTGSGSIKANLSGPYNYGTVVMIWANASIGSTFTGFSGDLSGTISPQTLVMNENKSITATFKKSGGGGGEEPPQEPENIKPIADASAGEPYQGLINSIIRFDGSRSYDRDGNITSWLWDFGDNTIANGVSVYHSFLEAGTYAVTLTVTDNQTATDTDTTTCVIRQSNRPPTKPTIEGPISGTKNTVYTYNASAIDPDNDPLQYTFEWGGSISQSSGFLPNGMNYSVNHNWTTAGRYNLTVTVTDNQNNSTSMITIYIDAIQTRGAGYLLDNDGDGIYDAFYSDETHQTVLIQRKGDSYLIDKDGDGNWEYVYNATYGLTSYQEPRKTPGFELVFTFGAIAAVLLISRKRKTL
jgi:uncharacterized repeat protein (TIGR02543 family)